MVHTAGARAHHVICRSATPTTVSSFEQPWLTFVLPINLHSGGGGYRREVLPAGRAIRPAHHRTGMLGRGDVLLASKCRECLLVGQAEAALPTCVHLSAELHPVAGAGAHAQQRAADDGAGGCRGRAPGGAPTWAGRGSCVYDEWGGRGPRVPRRGGCLLVSSPAPCVAPGQAASL